MASPISRARMPPRLEACCPLHAGLEVGQQRVGHRVGTAGDRLEQAAAADDDVERMDVAVVFFQRVQNDLLAEIFLVDDGGVFGDLLGRVAQRFVKLQRLVLKHADLGGGGTRVDDKAFDHGVSLPSLSSMAGWFRGHCPFICAATTAASAMELTLVLNESERLVRMAGTLVPVRMQPFSHSAVCTSVL